MGKNSRGRLVMALLGIAGLGALPILRAGADPVAARVLKGSLLTGQASSFFTTEISVANKNAIDCSSTTGCELWARPGNFNAGTVAAPINIPTWSYATAAADPAAGTGLPSDFAGAVGPTIVATAGQTLTIKLHNALPADVVTPTDTSLAMPRIAAAGSDSTDIPNGGMATLTFRVSEIGTSIYEAGSNTNTGNRQIAMGMAGVLVVRPRAGTAAPDCTAPAAAIAKCLYAGNAPTATDVFDDEALVALSDIDPAFNANPTTFDMADFSPKYHLINGKVFPNTDVIDVQTGDKLAIRYANLSPTEHTMGLIGIRETVVGRDATLLPHDHDVVTPLLTSGQTADAIVAVPAQSIYAGQRYALYDTARKLNNSGTHFGGALTFINVWSISNFDPASQLPVASLNLLNPDVFDGAQAINVTGTGPAAANAGLAFIDQVNGTSAGTVTAAGSIVTLTISTTVLDTLTNGSHVVYVQLSNDGGLNYGPAAGVAFTIDRLGPVMSATTVCTATCPPVDGVPTDAELARTNRIGDLTIHTTADASLTGTGQVQLAKYVTDATRTAGKPDCSGIPTSTTPLTSDTPVPAPVVGFSTTLTGTTATPLPFLEGKHYVQVAAQDVQLHWSSSGLPPLSAACDEAAFIVDETKPTTSAGSVDPSPNNGRQSANGNTSFLDAVRVTATITDPVSTGVNSDIVKAEAFLDGYYFDIATGAPTPGLPGSAVTGNGFELHPLDGAWDSPTEQVYAYIPLAVVRNLTPGPHGIWIHGQDAAGNWGTITTPGPDAILDYEPDAPTINTLTVNRAAGGTLTVGATAAAVGVSVTKIEYAVGLTAPTTPAGWTLLIGGGTASVLTGSTSPLAGLDSTTNVFVRVTDNLGHPSQQSLPVVGGITAAPGSVSYLVTSSTGDLTAVQYQVAPANAAPTGAWVTIAGAAGASPLSRTSAVPNAPAGSTIWLRAQDNQGNFGPATAVPVVSSVTRTGAGVTTATAQAGVGTTVASLDYIYAPAGAAPAATAVGWTQLAAGPTGSDTLGDLVPNVNQTIWFRAIDQYGNSSIYTAPLPVINAATFRTNNRNVNVTVPPGTTVQYGWAAPTALPTTVSTAAPPNNDINVANGGGNGAASSILWLRAQTDINNVGLWVAALPYGGSLTTSASLGSTTVSGTAVSPTGATITRVEWSVGTGVGDLPALAGAISLTNPILLGVGNTFTVTTTTPTGSNHIWIRVRTGAGTLADPFIWGPATRV